MRFILECVALWGLALFLGLLTAWLHPHAPQLREPLDPLAITSESIAALSESYLLVDARERSAYQAGHPPGAVLLNESEWNELLGVFLLEHYEPSTTYIVYCDGGGCDASKSVAKRLRDELPGTEAFYLKGGIEKLEGFNNE